jgi:antitoxin (DNA-binding transcriptional repressor) of toxin-antitoxin stability system
MSATITLEEAQAHLKELIGKLAPSEELVITENQRPVATLVGERPPRRSPRVPGRCKGTITLLVQDGEHLKDFEEYMP